MSNRHGHCLCGQVSVEIDEALTDVGVCHCSTCRTWTGGPMQALSVGHGVTFHGQEHITTYRSSEWAERAFCKTCGTTLFYRLVDSGEYYLSAGLFPDSTGFEMKIQVFIDEKPDFYDFANDTPKMTGAEVFALYAPKED